MAKQPKVGVMCLPQSGHEASFPSHALAAYVYACGTFAVWKPPSPEGHVRLDLSPGHRSRKNGQAPYAYLEKPVVDWTLSLHHPYIRREPC